MNQLGKISGGSQQRERLTWVCPLRSRAFFRNDTSTGHDLFRTTLCERDGFLLAWTSRDGCARDEEERDVVGALAAADGVRRVWSHAGGDTVEARFERVGGCDSGSVRAGDGLRQKGTQIYRCRDSIRSDRSRRGHTYWSE